MSSNEPDSAQYEELWSAIRGSTLVSMFVEELYLLARRIVERADTVFATVQSPQPGTSYLSSPHVRDELADIVLVAARIRALVFKRDKRRRGQSRSEYEVMEACGLAKERGAGGYQSQRSHAI